MKVKFMIDPSIVTQDIDCGKTPSDKILNAKSILCDTCEVDKVEDMYKVVQDFMRNENISKIILCFDNDIVSCDVIYHQYIDIGTLIIGKVGDDEWFYLNDSVNVRKLSEKEIRKCCMRCLYENNEYDKFVNINHILAE